MTSRGTGLKKNYAGETKSSRQGRGKRLDLKTKTTTQKPPKRKKKLITAATESCVGGGRRASEEEG